MAGNMSTLSEICIEKAHKQPGMLDSLLEDAPILGQCKWIPATHGMWNVAEKLTDIKGASFTQPDAPLPQMKVGTDLVSTDLFTLGGTMEVPSQRAKKFGGPEKYFSKHQDALLRKAGMDTEIALVKNNWLKGAIKEKNLRDAGATSKGWYLLAVRFDDLANVGLYDPDQFESGRLLRIDLPYNGAEHHLQGEGFEGVLGYAVAYRANFGWQLLDAKRTVSAIVNIDENNHPSADQIDDMLADVRATQGNTFIFCSPQARIHGINPHKSERVMLTNGDKDMQTYVESWMGIPIIMSYNITDKVAKVTV